MALSDGDNALLTEIASFGEPNQAWPSIHAMRAGKRPSERVRLQELVNAGLLREIHQAYVPTLAGLRALRTPWANDEIDRSRRLLDALRAVYAKAPGQVGSSAIAKTLPDWDDVEVGRILAVLAGEDIFSGYTSGGSPGLLGSVTLDDRILDADPFVESPAGFEAMRDWQGTADDVTLVAATVAGYGPLAGDTLRLDSIRVLVGANAAGKSSLGAALAWLSRLRDEPLPQEVDRARAGRDVFRKNATPLIAISLEFSLAGLSAPQERLGYEMVVTGPVGQARIANEVLDLGSDEILRREGDRLEGPLASVFGNRAPSSSDLVLRRFDLVQIPALTAIAEHIRRWRVYAGFDIGPLSPMRMPALSDPAPVLRPDGHNLIAVLVGLWSRNRDDLWADLEATLRAAIPGFLSLRVEPFGAPGHWRGVWREEGVEGDLTLSELSDGTLQLLCWAALCLSPGGARFLILDEPEAGLHPRVVGILADLIRRAAEHAQVLVMTHSPQLLANFALTDILAIRREDGAARIVRPADSHALVKLVEELGEEGIVRAFTSDELEQLP